ncbi:MAG: DEAD/DEAH box helicase family protein, partial [Rhodoglobus sp.]
MPKTQLAIPALEYRDKVPCGHIVHVLAPARTTDVVQVGRVLVSPRIEEDLLTLSTGEKLVVTKRPKVPRPPGADGVLRDLGGNRYAWLAHKNLEELTRRTAKRGWSQERDAIRASWVGAFSYNKERKATPDAPATVGLRPPQIGALHAIAAHWSLETASATIVMPTGTGKTETMLATLVAESEGTMLVTVPSKALRDQTVRKFRQLGLLRDLGCLSTSSRNPIVGVVERRPRTDAELRIFERCNVVIGTIGALAQGAATATAGAMAAAVDALVVDEAHHVAAKTWSEFREEFAGQRVLQFTATPYRRDGQLVDGRVIYTYPLGAAQRDGYFKPVNFVPVYEIDEADADKKIAEVAIARLKQDLANGLNHVVMARCDSITRAKAIHVLYRKLARQHTPVLIHSKSADTQASLEKLRTGKSRVVVCVDMLGEGFDLPELKIAALHDPHKSLAILMQFTGRFTRTAGDKLGDATVIANTADPMVLPALDRLYSEDADWNKLLRELSSDAVKTHAEMVAFLQHSQRLDESGDAKVDIAPSLLRPKFSTVAFKVTSWEPKRFFDGLPEHAEVQAAWLHEGERTLYFATRSEQRVEWTRAKELRDRAWDLYVLHYDERYGLLYLHSSDKDSTHDGLAKAVSGGSAQLINGDKVFRVLGGINRLRLQILGIKKYGRRNLRYAMYTGADVSEALTSAEKGNSTKSNLTASGWEGGEPARIGCSAKGRVWSIEAGSIPVFTRWMRHVGQKLQDESISTQGIISNVLVPKEATSFPTAAILCIEWPDELLRQDENRVPLRWAGNEAMLWAFDLVLEDAGRTATGFSFTVRSDDATATYAFDLGTSGHFSYRRVSGAPFEIQVGRKQMPLETYLSDYPLLVRFVDMTDLDGAT